MCLFVCSPSSRISVSISGCFSDIEASICDFNGLICDAKPFIFVQGNVDENLYATVPDNQMPLSAKGRTQARAAAQTLKGIIGNETVKFYVSPYVRTLQTFAELAKVLEPKQWTVREEPRLREQDFGNFQNTEKILRCRQERKLFGAFYYRFPQVCLFASFPFVCVCVCACVCVCE